MASVDIDYTATNTGADFHSDDSFVRAILGPVGGGKTVMAVMEILYKAMKQAPDKGGVRRTRHVVIRQSYPMLLSTVIKTFEDWLGPLGKITFGTPIVWKARFDLSDGTTVSTEVQFMALERPEDAAKLRSLEVSHAMISEFAEIPDEILTMLRGRVGRYPSKKYGVECTSPSIWMESNPYNTRSHWYQLFQVKMPKGHTMFRQPPPLFHDVETDTYHPNPAAENIDKLPGGFDYYYNQLNGASAEYINVYILGNFGATFSGQRIYPTYEDALHCPSVPFRPVTKSTLIIGMDFGLNAAGVVTEQTPMGGMHALDEVCGEDIMFEEYVDDHLRPLLFHDYKGWPLMVVGDPSDNTGKAAYSLLMSRGIPCQPSSTNDPIQRWDAVKWFLSKRGGFLLSPNCTILREGFLGGYAYKKTAVNINANHTGRADKNHTSHPHDALQYAALHYRRASARSKRPPVQRKPTLWA